MDMNEIVGKRIAESLENKGWTQVKLADKMGLSRQIINNIIQGKRNITVAEIKDIAGILEVSVDDLIKPFAKDKEEEIKPIIAFMGEVSTDEAKEGLKRAQEIMDMIVFHENIKESFDKMISN